MLNIIHRLPLLVTDTLAHLHWVTLFTGLAPSFLFFSSLSTNVLNLHPHAVTHLESELAYISITCASHSLTLSPSPHAHSIDADSFLSSSVSLAEIYSPAVLSTFFLLVLSLHPTVIPLLSSSLPVRVKVSFFTPDASQPPPTYHSNKDQTFKLSSVTTVKSIEAHINLDFVYQEEV